MLARGGAADPETPMSPEVGQVINGKYRIARKIGDGGMGSVFEAIHEALGSKVALKFLHPELSRTGVAARFLQEARASARIQSPHVVRVTDVDQTPDGLAFIVLEYLEGRTLQKIYEDLYDQGRSLGYADALEYAVQICEGVEAAHEAGIIHRDLKPDNVMITTGPKGVPLVKLLDFGIAKVDRGGRTPTPTAQQPRKGLTRPGVLLGTPEYMAPEQVYSAETADVRADIFSLGVMFFEMFAGRRPVGGDEPHQIAVSHVTGEISRLGDLAPGLPPELSAGIHRAMSAQPKDRFSSVHELRELFEPYAMALRPPQLSRLGGASSLGVALPPPGASAPNGTPGQVPAGPWVRPEDPFAATSPRQPSPAPIVPEPSQGLPPPHYPTMGSYPPVPTPQQATGSYPPPVPVSVGWTGGAAPMVSTPPPPPAPQQGWSVAKIAILVGLLLAGTAGATAAVVYYAFDEPGLNPKAQPTAKKPVPVPPKPKPAPSHKPPGH